MTLSDTSREPMSKVTFKLSRLVRALDEMMGSSSERNQKHKSEDNLRIGLNHIVCWEVWGPKWSKKERTQNEKTEKNETN